ncbi:Glycosyltransferase [Quillaja saponaria]|uniref:Glycosyltransferase n=1 Tax=Quillaja saponaria TaxID=32244 RepID=A0AAD7Q001_QUISA|nr:Glycosyltransferase [Quillaja saponaria]
MCHGQPTLLAKLEPAYVKDYKKAKGDKVWCIGPVSLCNKDELDKARRGNYKASIDEHQCLKWLDSWESRSVIYACHGSLCNLTALQLIELALALEASKRPFIWAIRGGNKYQELVRWNKEDEYEERIKARAILIWDWAPQILILSHPAIGGFLTHCESIEEYKKLRNGKAWCVGPVWLCNKNELDKAERGNKASIDEHYCLEWLNLQEENSVVYACLGSVANLSASQLIELGLGLEASKRPFV